MTKRIIVWFQNDLRVEDQVALYEARQKSDQLFPIYCLDPRQFGLLSNGRQKSGAFRLKFLLESLQDLRKNLQKLGGDLLIRVGYPEEIIPELAKQLEAEAVYASQEVGSEEEAVHQVLEAKLWQQKVKLETFWQSTLYHLSDLPKPLNNLPDIFTQFRKGVEKYAQVRKALPLPARIFPLPDNFERGQIPSLGDLGYHEIPEDDRAAIRFEGGETAGKQRLKAYFWEREALSKYKETRNGLLGEDYSSKFSPWLALGCLSPRWIYEQVAQYEREVRKNQSTYWLIFELIWRDYFRFVGKKYANRLFYYKGIKGQLPFKLHQDQARFERWANAQTGIPFIDANMEELNRTGFMSNRGRQNVASFLVKDLRLDWRWGAAYFEQKLIDYDVCSNWGNWQYVAGVGNDPRENRYFNILSQARRYDPQGEYVAHWLPALKALPENLRHCPSEAEAHKLKAYDFYLGKDYPAPMVSPERWLSTR